MMIPTSTSNDIEVMHCINSVEHGLRILQDIDGDFYWIYNGTDSMLLPMPLFYPRAIDAVSGAFEYFCCC